MRAVPRVRSRASEDRWQSHPVLANLLRLLLLAAPLLTSASVVYGIGWFLTPDERRSWWGLSLVLVAGVVTAVASERAARRLLPLTVLLRLTMLFPDRAPSRLRLARRAATAPPTELFWSGAGAAPTTTSDTVHALMAALGTHDRKTRGHSERVRVLCDVVAGELKLDEDARDRLRWAALLHDIGKMAVAPRVLNKPAALDRAEFDAVKEHPEMGASIAAPLLPWLGEWGRGILEHHERYDGTGYPLGISGSDISDSGRIIAIVDSFETMTAARAYKKPLATKAAREELARCAGSQFDPTYVRAFLAVSLPRMMWALGPLSFLVHAPFLRSLAEAGARSSVATGQAAAGVAGAAAIATAGAGIVATTVVDAPPADASPSVAAPLLLPPDDGPDPISPPKTRGSAELPAAQQGGTGSRKPQPTTSPAAGGAADLSDGPAPGEQSAAGPDAEPGTEPGEVAPEARPRTTPEAERTAAPGAGPKTAPPKTVAPRTPVPDPTPPAATDDGADRPAPRPSRTAPPTGLPVPIPLPPLPLPTALPLTPADRQVHLVAAPAAVTSSRSATFVLATAPGLDLLCRDTTDGSGLGGEDAGWRPCTSPVRFSRLAPGQHTFQARSVDADGRRGAVTSHSWRVLDRELEERTVPQLPDVPGLPDLPDLVRLAVRGLLPGW